MEGYWAEQLGTYVWDSNPGYNAVWCSDNPRTGMKHSDETRQKISVATTNMSDERRRKLSVATTNMSDETRQKMSVAKKGHIVSDETRRKLSVATTNMSDERRRKLSEAGKRAWASKRVIAFID